MTKDYLKEDFTIWMKQQLKEDGRPYSTNTINSYVTSLKNATAKLKGIEIGNTDLFSYTTVSAFKKVYQDIVKQPDFQEVDIASANKAYSCGMKLYFKFLEGFEPVKTSLLLDDELDGYISYLKVKTDFFNELANNTERLYEEINKLHQNHSLLNSIIEIYDNSTGPLNIVRLVILKAIQQGVIITEEFVQEVKDKFNKKDTTYFSKYLNSTVLSHIVEYRAKNGGNPFQSWKDPFRIFYVYFFNGEVKATTKRYLDSIGRELIARLGLDSYTLRTVDFDGCQNQGQQLVWISLYPERLKNYNNAIQLFCEINNNTMYAGIYKGSRVRQDIVIEEQGRKNAYNSFNDMIDGLRQQVNQVIKLNNSISEDDVEEVKTRYWMYSAGEKSKYWDDFYDEGIMGIGWDNELEDLSQYKSKTEIQERLIQLYPNSSNKNNALANWQFANELKAGDVIYVKKGNSLIVGRGIVESGYIYEENRNPYKNIRKVTWTHKGEWNTPSGSDNVVKTLTDITPYTDYVKQLEKLFDLSVEDNINTDYETYTEDNFLEDVFMSPMRYETLKNLLLTKKNIILQGAPGVGKTYTAKRLAYSILGVKDTSKVKIVQFHQSYGYEDFIMGYRPSNNGFELKYGPFYNFCKEAEQDSDNKYFFIIDEINRGKLSKIFGELLMLIETDKRGSSLQLLYNDEQFSVPENVYIIGMMNTADRGLAMIDYALRRRFSFFEFEPAFETESFRLYQSNKVNEKYSKLINEIIQLNKVIAEDCSLGDGFRIGHSYFCCDSDIITDEWLKNVLDYEILPLLKEYWFDEQDKVREWSNKLMMAIK